MKRPITGIAFRGYYEVAKASDFLTAKGIRNEIVRAPIQKTHSCSFTIAVYPEDIDITLEYLKPKNNFCVQKN